MLQIYMYLWLHDDSIHISDRKCAADGACEYVREQNIRKEEISTIQGKSCVQLSYSIFNSI